MNIPLKCRIYSVDDGAKSTSGEKSVSRARRNSVCRIPQTVAPVFHGITGHDQQSTISRYESFTNYIFVQFRGCGLPLSEGK